MWWVQCMLPISLKWNRNVVNESGFRKTWTAISHFFAQTNFYLNLQVQKRRGQRQLKIGIWEVQRHVLWIGGIHNTLITGRRFTYGVAFFPHITLNLFVTVWKTSRVKFIIVGNSIKCEWKGEVCENLLTVFFLTCFITCNSQPHILTSILFSFFFWKMFSTYIDCHQNLCFKKLLHCSPASVTRLIYLVSQSRFRT